MKLTRTIASILLLVVLLVMPVAGASAYNQSSSVVGTITFSPNSTSMDLYFYTSVDSSNLTAFQAELNYTLDPTTCSAEMYGNLYLESPQLQGVNLQANYNGTGQVQVNETEAMSNHTNVFLLHGEAINGSDYYSINLYYEKQSSKTYQLETYSYTGQQSSMLNLSITYMNTTSTISLELNLSSTSQAQGDANMTAGSGHITGPVTFQQDTYQLSMNVDITYEYKVYAENNTIQITATTNLEFQDYMTAFQAYMMLSYIVSYLNLANNLTLVPPTTTNPVVSIILEYQDNLTDIANMTMPMPMPGMPGGSMMPGMMNASMMMPIVMPSQPPTGNISYITTLDLVINNGELAANLQGNATLPPGACSLGYLPTSLQISSNLDTTTSTIETHVTGYLQAPEPFTPFAIVKKIIMKAGEELHSTTLNITLEGTNGVSFIYNGQVMDTIQITNENVDSLEYLGIIYNGTTYYGFDKPTEISQENTRVMVTPFTNNIILKNVNTATIMLPFEQPKLTDELSITVESNSETAASITLHKDTMIQGDLQVSYHSPDLVTIPSELDVQPIGNALTIKNATGTALVKIKVETETGTLGLLIIHDNGTYELLTNATIDIEAGYIIAEVSTQSTYLPVQIVSTPPPTENTTTTTTTETEETTTTTATTTTTTETETETTTTTHETTTQTTTTISETETTSTTTTATETTQTTTTGEEQTTPTTEETTQGTNNLLIAGIVVVIIILAALAWKFTR